MPGLHPTLSLPACILHANDKSQITCNEVHVLTINNFCRFMENCNSHLIIVNYGVTMLGSTFTDQNVNRNYKSMCNVMIWCKLLH